MISRFLRSTRREIEKSAAERPDISIPGSAKELWYPIANIVEPEMKTRGYYKHGYPQGAVVHYTAGRHGDGAVAYGRKKGYTYLLIDETGVVHQAFPLNRWGYHAGKSSYPDISGIGVSSFLLGIEIACAGKLTKNANGWETWWGDGVDPKYVAHVTQKIDNVQPGAYHLYTPAQERALTALLVWLYKNGDGVFRPDWILGHDEVSPGRKTDPGGSLSCTMPAYREYIKNLIS